VRCEAFYRYSEEGKAEAASAAAPSVEPDHRSTCPHMEESTIALNGCSHVPNRQHCRDVPTSGNAPQMAHDHFEVDSKKENEAYIANVC
jgi:hypothetical protein